MIGSLIALLSVLAVIVLAIFYMLLLSALYPEKQRANEVYYLRTRDLWLLRVCRYRKDDATGEPVLLVHGMGANQNNFAYPEGGCLVDYLSEKGYDCWTLDLRGCRSSEPPFERTRNEVRMEDFFLEDLPAVIQHILKTTRYPKLHWVGHSMGGMLLYAFVQAHGNAQIASGTTLGSPIDFNDAAGNVPTWLVGFGAAFPRLTGNIIRGIIPILKGLGVAQGVFPVNMRNLPVEINAGHFIHMIEDPLPGLMRQVSYWIKNREYKLDNGRLDIAEGMKDFSVPLLAFYAAVDPFINSQRALGVFDQIRIKDKRAHVCSREKGYGEDYNHCDLAFGKAATTEIFDPIGNWLQQHPCPLPETVKKGAGKPVKGPLQDKPVPGTAPIQAVAAKPAAAEPEASLVKTPTKTKAAPKSAPAKKTAAKIKTKTKAASPAKAPAKPKIPARKKAASAKKPVASRKPAASAKKAPAIPEPVAEKEVAMDSLEVSPEALARAEAIRAARNRAFAEIDALLEEKSER